ncbi:MAG: EndoU domain-containing protein [Propionibacteriaceae bacterium]|jgi:hypothetical protein|nr:EndoU domain-containing protein [Propionibacteriaceae bacterium]
MAEPLNNLPQFRQVQEAIVARAVTDFRAFAAKVDWSKTDTDSKQLSALFQVAVPRIIQKYAAMAAAMACDFYDEARAAAGVKSFVKSEAQPAPPAEGIEAQVRYAARWLFGANPQPSKMLDFLEGEIDKKVKAAYRNTIAVSASLDPAKPGLRRIPAGTCDFCKLLAKRDAEYLQFHGRQIVMYEYHPGCKCVPVAVWSNVDGGRDSGIVGNRHADGVRSEESWLIWQQRLGVDSRPCVLTADDMRIILDGVITDALKGTGQGGHLWGAVVNNKTHFPASWTPGRCASAIQAVMDFPQYADLGGTSLIRRGLVDGVIVEVVTWVDSTGIVRFVHGYPKSGNGVMWRGWLGELVARPLNLTELDV